MAERLLLVPAGQRVVRIVPPLVIRKSQLSKLCRRLERALQRLD
jgi:acetylornithine aminotransferase